MAQSKLHLRLLAGVSVCGRGSTRLRLTDNPRAVTCSVCVQRMTDTQRAERDRPARMITRINLMSGQAYQESEDTPAHCSPASETYWSM